MGFSGGGANVTKAHTHDGAVVQDGGSLAANATQFGLTNGSLLFSDGTNIQELGVGNSGYVLGTASGTTPTWEASAASVVMNVNGQMVYYDGSRTALNIGSESDVLTVSAGGLPVWTAPAPAATSSYEFIERFTATASDTFTCTLATPLPIGDFIKLVGIWRGAWNASGGSAALELEIVTNNETLNSGYSWAANVMRTSSTATFATDSTNFIIGASTTVGGSKGRIDLDLTMIPAPSDQLNNVFVKWWQVGSNVLNAWGSGFSYDNSGSAITTIDGFIFTNSAGQNIETGTTLDLFKIAS